MDFISLEHKNNYKELMEKVDLGAGDVERKALFYILTGNAELYKNIAKVYNFKESGVKIEMGEDDKFYIPNLNVSSSAKALANLGVQLFNSTTEQTVINTFCNLDTNNFNLAINAIRIRFGIEQNA